MKDLSFDGSIWCNIDMTIRNLDTIYKQETEPLGLSVIEWHILRLLYEQDGQMAGRLAEGVGRAATAFTPILDKIQDKGFIERRSHPADRRAVKIYLTKQGQALKESIVASAEKIESKLRQQFSGKEWRGYESVVADLQRMMPETN